MRKIVFLVILLLGIFSSQVSAKWFQKKTIFSKAIQQEKTYFVGLPDGYNESDLNKKYPVVIFLHGASVNAEDIVNTLEPNLDNFLGRFLMPNLFKVILVIPDGSCEPYKGSFYTNSQLYGNYEDYIVQDITAEVENNYNTYKASNKWSIMGHSMGGFGAMKIALKYPEKFIGVSSLSGPLNVTYFDDLLPVIRSEHGSVAPYNFDYSGNVTKLVYSMAGAFSPNLSAVPPIDFPINADGNMNQSVLASWEPHNPINLIRPWKGNPAMAIHMYCGEKDEFMLAKPNRMFADTLKKYNLPHTYIQDPNGDHVNSILTSFPQGINFLYQVMDTAKVRLVTGIDQFNFTGMPFIYPNPAGDQFRISGMQSDLSQIIIFNSSGQKVLQINRPPANSAIDIHNLIPGLYFVSLESSGKSSSGLKLIKK